MPKYKSPYEKVVERLNQHEPGLAAIYFPEYIEKMIVNLSAEDQMEFMNEHFAFSFPTENETTWFNLFVTDAIPHL